MRWAVVFGPVRRLAVMVHAVEVPASLSPPPARLVLLECYTDPLCHASRAFEPHWQRLRAEFGHRFDWCYRLSGLAASRPACLAVKCAERQGPHAGDLYLRAVREAAMRHGRNIARPEVLAAVANELAVQVPTVFDAVAFHEAMATGAGTPALRKDLQRVRSSQISQLPAIIVRRGTGPGRLIPVGNRPYEALLQALAGLAPDLFYVPCLVDGGAG